MAPLAALPRLSPAAPSATAVPLPFPPRVRLRCVAPDHSTVLIVAAPERWSRAATAALSSSATRPVVLPHAPAAVAGVAAVVVAHARLVDVLRACSRPRAGRWFPVVAVTAPSDPAAAVDALERGADDCIALDAPIDELRARLHRLVRRPRPGRRAEDEGCLVVGDLAIDVGRRVAHVAGREVLLSATQFDLLVVLAREGGAAVSTARLLAVGWDAHQPTSSALLRPQLARLRKALGSAASVTAVRGCGYRLEVATPGTGACPRTA